jgi:protocatechuate 3,4-dioxygenase beta subunit
VTVVILDQSGQPCEDVVVTLERLGQSAAGARTARTDADGTATFRGVPPSTYRAVAAAPSIASSQVVFTVVSGRMPTRAELRVRALPRH